MFVSDSLAENNGLVIHGKKESSFLSSCTDATFEFLEAIGTQAGKETSWAKFRTRRREVRLEIINAELLRKAKVNKDSFTLSQTLHGKTTVGDASGSNTDVAHSQISIFKYSNNFDEQNFQKNKPIPIDVW